MTLNILCIDLDECMDSSLCDQVCENTFGGYECSCNPGYKLQMDNSTCEGSYKNALYFVQHLPLLEMKCQCDIYGVSVHPFGIMALPSICITIL